MSWVKFSVAVVLTSAALVVALVATGAFMVGNVLASSAPMAQFRGAGGGWNMPPELASLKDVPADQRFSHFKGVQANLTDKDGKPIAISVTPGVATAVSATSLTINANDGVSHTYALDAQTMTHGKAVATGEDVVVLTFNNGTTARGVFAPSTGDWGHK